jgi:tricarboxylate carrier
MWSKTVGATFGLVAGVGAIVAGTQYINKRDVPKFNPNGDRYDQRTFQGRYFRMLSQCDPLTLLESESEVRRAEKLVKEYDPQTSREGDAELWAARVLKESAVHPDTQEIVPLPFRMSGYVPFNGPVCVAMMVSQTTPTLLFWNWVNQSQNALVNYFNRNASSPTSNETLAVSYSAAVAAALSVAFGLSQVVQRKFSPEKAKTLMQFIAFPASMVASSANCYIMRRPEIERGIVLMDDGGRVVADGAKSSIAAEKAVIETAVSRAFLGIPCFLLPAAIMSLPPIARFCAASPSMGLGLYTFVSIILFGFGLPATVAIFPQTGSIPVDRLESPIRSLLSAGGNSPQVVYYNKGL